MDNRHCSPSYTSFCTLHIPFALYFFFATTHTPAAGDFLFIHSSISQQQANRQLSGLDSWVWLFYPTPLPGFHLDLGWNSGDRMEEQTRQTVVLQLVIIEQKELGLTDSAHCLAFVCAVQSRQQQGWSGAGQGHSSLSLLSPASLLSLLSLSQLFPLSFSPSHANLCSLFPYSPEPPHHVSCLVCTLFLVLALCLVNTMYMPLPILFFFPLIPLDLKRNRDRTGKKDWISFSDEEFFSGSSEHL